MSDENSALDSVDVSQYDELTTGYRQRLASAMSTLRSQSYYSGLDPIPSAPQADPDPPAEGADISQLESNKVSYYDGLTATHNTQTGTEVSRYNTRLNEYIAYYNRHHDTPYTAPTSQVQPLNVVDDQSTDELNTNLVDAYDSAASGYSGISTSSASTAGTRSSAFTSKLSAAVTKINNLKNGNDSSSMPKRFQAATNLFDEKFDRNDSSVTNRNNMSVREASLYDFESMKTTFNTAMTNFKNNVLTPFKNGIIDAIEAMETAVKNGTKTVEQINKERAKALRNQGYTKQQIADAMHLTLAEVNALLQS